LTRKKDFTFPLSTDVELIAIKGEKVFSMILTYEYALNVPRKKGWNYRIYQIGFAQYKGKIQKSM